MFDLHEFEIQKTQFELETVAKEYESSAHAIDEKFGARLDAADSKAAQLGYPKAPERHNIEQKQKIMMHALERRTAKARKHLKKSGGRWVRHEFPPVPEDANQFALTEDTISKLRDGQEIPYENLFPSSAPELFKEFYGFDINKKLQTVWAPQKFEDEDDEDEMDLMALRGGDKIVSISGIPVVTFEQAERELRRARRVSPMSVLMKVFHESHFAGHEALDQVSVASQDELDAELEEME